MSHAIPSLRSVAKSALRRAGVRREQVAKARMLAERYALALGARPAPRSGGRILCYHSIGEPRLGVNDIGETRFRAQIDLALAEGYRFRRASDLARDGGTAKDLAITFDDAWTSTYTRAAPILKGYGIPWTLFAVSDWSTVPEQPWRPPTLSWAQLRELQDAGVELGSHSASHPNFGVLTADEARRELVESRAAFEEHLGTSPSTFAIPLGQSSNWNQACADEARAAGYDIVYAQAEETRPPQTVPRTFVTCFDGPYLFRGVLSGAFDRWEEWF